MAEDAKQQKVEAGGAGDDPHPWRTDIRALRSGVNLVVLILAIAAGVWGVFASLSDAAGDGFGGNLAIAAPGIYAGWCMLVVAWARLANVGTLLLRLFTACFVAPAFVAAPIGVVQAVAVAFPGVRRIIAEAAAQNGGFHYWWDEGVAAQLFLVPMAGYVVGMCVPLGVALIIVLPVVSIRAPRIAAEGSHLEKVEGGRRDSTTAFVFVGLGMTTLGIGLWAFGDGGSLMDFPEGLADSLESLSYGEFSMEVLWPLGVILVVAGVLSMAWGCLVVIRARMGTSGGQVSGS